MSGQRSCTIALRTLPRGLVPFMFFVHLRTVPQENEMRTRKLSVCVVILAALSLLLVSAQNLTAQQAGALLTGTVKDSTGAVIAGAKVTLKNSDTNVGRTIESNKGGDYLFPQVPIGTYEV